MATAISLLLREHVFNPEQDRFTLDLPRNAQVLTALMRPDNKGALVTLSNDRELEEERRAFVILSDRDYIARLLHPKYVGNVYSTEFAQLRYVFEVSSEVK